MTTTKSLEQLALSTKQIETLTERQLDIAIESLIHGAQLVCRERSGTYQPATLSEVLSMGSNGGVQVKDSEKVRDVRPLSSLPSALETALQNLSNAQREHFEGRLRGYEQRCGQASVVRRWRSLLKAIIET